MKKLKLILSFFLGILLMTPVFAFSSLALPGGDVVFISETGNDTRDGSSPVLAVSTLYRAVKLLPCGGTVVLCSEYTIASVTELPEHKGLIVYTSLFGGTDYAKTRFAKLTMSANLRLSGDSRFENITLNVTASNLVLFGCGNDLTMGSGITCERKTSSLTYLSITAGGGDNYIRSGSSLTINSGTYHRIRGGNRSSGEIHGDTYVTINGGAFNSIIEGGGASAQTGDIRLTVNGGSFTGTVYGTSSAGLDGNLYITVTGGNPKITISGGGKITGTATVYLLASGASFVSNTALAAGGCIAYVPEAAAGSYSAYSKVYALSAGELTQQAAAAKTAEAERAAAAEATRAADISEETAKLDMKESGSYGAVVDYTLTADKETAQDGEKVHITATVTNSSKSTAENITLTSSSDKLVFSQINAGSLSGGETKTITFDATVGNASVFTGPPSSVAVILISAGVLAAAAVILFFILRRRRAAALILALCTVIPFAALTIRGEAGTQEKTAYSLDKLLGAVVCAYDGGLCEREWSLYGNASVTQDGVISAGNGGCAFAGLECDDNLLLDFDVLISQEGEFSVYFEATADDTSGYLLISGFCVRVNTAAKTLTLYKVTVGRHILYGTAEFEFSAGRTYHVRIETEGRFVTVYFDNNSYNSDPYPKLSVNMGANYKGGIGFLSTDEGFSFSGIEIGSYINSYTGGTYTNPILTNFTDPEVFYYDGLYYIYGTTSGDTTVLNCYTTKDFSKLTPAGAVMYAADVWGDSVIKAANIVEYDGWFYMFYMAKPTGGESRSSVASSRSPLGPFTSAVKAPLSQTVDVIGGQPFVDTDGKCYLTLAHIGSGNELWVHEMVLSDGVASVNFDTAVCVLKAEDKWENAIAPVTECGYIIKHNGLYYMLYSGGNYNSTYGTGYATAESPMGPYTRYEYNPILRSTESAFATGASTVFLSPDGSEYFIAYISSYTSTSVRPLCTRIDRMKFVKNPLGEGPDIIEIHGPTNSPQPLPSTDGAEASDGANRFYAP